MTRVTPAAIANKITGVQRRRFFMFADVVNAFIEWIREKSFIITPAFWLRRLVANSEAFHSLLHPTSSLLVRMTRKILSACGLIDALYNVLICMEDYAVLRLSGNVLNPPPDFSGWTIFR